MLGRASPKTEDLRSQTHSSVIGTGMFHADQPCHPPFVGIPALSSPGSIHHSDSPWRSETLAIASLSCFPSLEHSLSLSLSQWDKDEFFSASPSLLSARWPFSALRSTLCNLPGHFQLKSLTLSSPVHFHLRVFYSPSASWSRYWGNLE